MIVSTTFQEPKSTTAVLQEPLKSLIRSDDLKLEYRRPDVIEHASQHSKFVLHESTNGLLLRNWD